ncbi:MAG TPA: CCC motif membrane protein [Chitinophagaceae bacterium]|nr:CCC motif membrane protein [Chitinophagaceae bacterium]
MENQPPYQQPYQQPYSPGPQQMPLPNATAILVLGIISIVGCICYGIPGLICSIIALVLAKKDLQLYANNPEAYTMASYSNLKSGRICAIIGLSLSALFFLFVIIYFIFVGSLVLSSHNGIFNHM